ncbi:MAG: transcription antitermination factor NusB [Clostridiales bacterium]|jgi:N utilization substance protein B|nr:transcription antitermination factor NusB [Clostridiales bacterium]
MKRRAEREQAFLLIFERTINNDTMADIIENANLSRDMELSAFASNVALGVEEKESIIDQKIEQSILGWKMSRLSKVSFALLRLAIYEMMFEKDIPISVSINEVIDLAKKYGGSEDAPFINGVLGTVAKDLDLKNE